MKYVFKYSYVPESSTHKGFDSRLAEFSWETRQCANDSCAAGSLKSGSILSKYTTTKVVYLLIADVQNRFWLTLVSVWYFVYTGSLFFDSDITLCLCTKLRLINCFSHHLELWELALYTVTEVSIVADIILSAVRFGAKEEFVWALELLRYLPVARTETLCLLFPALEGKLELDLTLSCFRHSECLSPATEWQAQRSSFKLRVYHVFADSWAALHSQQ